MAALAALLLLLLTVILMANGPIDALAQELMKRELAKNPDQFTRKPFDLGLDVGPESQPLSPGMLATLGGLADAASTYTFLKRGTGVEGNPLLKFTNNHPLATGLGAVGGLAATKGITALIRKKFPKLADALAANVGAEQLGLAVGNVTENTGGERDSYSRYGNTLTRFTTGRK